MVQCGRHSHLFSCINLVPAVDLPFTCPTLHHASSYHVIHDKPSEINGKPMRTSGRPKNSAVAQFPHMILSGNDFQWNVAESWLNRYVLFTGICRKMRTFKTSSQANRTDRVVLLLVQPTTYNVQRTTPDIFFLSICYILCSVEYLLLPRHFIGKYLHVIVQRLLKNLSLA